MYRNDFPTFGLNSGLCNAYSFYEMYFSVHVTLTPSELIIVSVTDTSFYICMYMFIHVYI